MKRTMSVVLLWVAGCGGQEEGPGAGEEMFGDGSRLVAIWDQAPGTPRRQSGWYDTELATQCRFTPDFVRDGRSLCLPFPFWVQTSLTHFADAACTVPIVAASASTRWLWVAEPSMMQAPERLAITLTTNTPTNVVRMETPFAPT